MGKLKIGPVFAVVYIAAFLISFGSVATYIFDFYVAPLIPTSLTLSTYQTILNDAIVVNGVILGFVLVVLDGNMKDFRKTPEDDKDFWVRFTVLAIDLTTVFLLIYGLIGDMFGLVGIATSTASQLNKALFLPIVFADYVLFRFVALALT